MRFGLFFRRRIGLLLYMEKHTDKGRAHLDLKGQIERITYSNEENGYTIAKMKAQGRAGLVTIVGTLYSVSPARRSR